MQKKKYFARSSSDSSQLLDTERLIGERCHSQILSILGFFLWKKRRIAHSGFVNFSPVDTKIIPQRRKSTGLALLSTDEIDHFTLSVFSLLRIKNGNELFDQNDSSGSQVDMIQQEIGDKHDDRFVSILLEDGSLPSVKKSEYNTLNTKSSFSLFVTNHMVIVDKSL